MSANNCASITLSGSSAPPDQLAIALPSASGALQGPQISFGELRQRIAEFQRGIDRAGLRPGDRVVMLSPVSIDFYAGAGAVGLRSGAGVSGWSPGSTALPARAGRGAGPGHRQRATALAAVADHAPAVEAATLRQRCADLGSAESRSATG